jgi:uncharacterized membrane protein YfcA
VQIEAWQWVVLAAGSALVGLSKTGIAGLGILTVAIFAAVLPARASTGVLLPLLICGDFVAVAAYRRHAVWSHLLRLCAWVAIGVIAGFLAMGRLQGDRVFQRLIGWILIGMIGLHVWRQYRLGSSAGATRDSTPQGAWFAALMGTMAGFTTMVANAAGPVMILYLLAMRLPKMEFIGTGAWFFLGVNLFKVPFSWELGLVNAASLGADLRLAPAVVAGALAGRLLIPHINQRLFETLALVLSAIAALRMVV